MLVVVWFGCLSLLGWASRLAGLLRELREHGADMNAADYAGNTPSRLAAGELNTTAR